MGKMAVSFKDSLDAFKTVDSELAQLQAAFSEAELLKVMGAATKQMIPDVRAALERSYDASGVGTRTGILRKVVATNAIISAGPFGFRVEYGAKASYPAGGGNVYANASSKKYGAIYGKGGAKLSARLKKKLLATPGAVRSVSGFPDFYEFRQADIKSLQSKFVTIIKTLLIKRSKLLRAS
jgi:hypothetical protein